MNIEYDSLELLYLFESEPFDLDGEATDWAMVNVGYTRTINKQTLKLEIVNDRDLVYYSLKDEGDDHSILDVYIYNATKIYRENNTLTIVDVNNDENNIFFDDKFSFLSHLNG